MDDKKYLFISHIYDTRWACPSLEQLASLRQRHLTSFKVKRDVFHAFFGNSLESPPAQQTSEAIPPSDQMIGVESTDSQCATEMTEPPSNQALPSIAYPSTPSTSTHNASDNMQLASETNNVLHNDMQLDPPQAQESSKMVVAHLRPEPTQIHVLEPPETSMKRARPPLGPAGSLGIIGAQSISTTMEIDIPETPEPLQITNLPHDNAQEASPERALPGTFPVTSIQPLETNERPLENAQYLLTAGKQVWPKERTVKELMDLHASIELTTLKPILLFQMDTREYQYFEPQWPRLHDFVTTYLKEEIKLRFMYIDQTKQLHCCSCRTAFSSAMGTSGTRFMFFETLVPGKNVLGRKLADLDSPVSRRVQAIEDVERYNGPSFTEFRG